MNSENVCAKTEHFPIALLLIDTINDLNFEGNGYIVHHAPKLAQSLADLKREVKGLNIPVVYVNDNFQKWQSNFNQLFDHCIKDGVPGRVLAEALTPEPDDFFVLKPKHSGFFGTPLQILLQHLEVQQLILAGLAGNICVLYTANDAYMHGYKLFVPEDASLSNSVEENAYAIKQMEKLLKADVRPISELLNHLQNRFVTADKVHR